jgi:hypothetical protein
MRPFIILISALAALMGCGQQKQNPSTQNTDAIIADTMAVVNDPKNNLNIQTTRFSEVDGSGILMFPLTMGESERDGSSMSYKEMPGNSCWNIIFLNSKTNAYHLLSNRKMLINNYDFKFGSSIQENLPKTSQYLFYEITTDDYNNDKKLTAQDPEYLFVSDKEGKNFRQISPAHFNLLNWQFLQSVNKVILTVKMDSDMNGKYDNYDEVTTFEVEIDKGTAPREVFSTDFKNQLKILYDRDWKRIKP